MTVDRTEKQISVDSLPCPEESQLRPVFNRTFICGFRTTRIIRVTYSRFERERNFTPHEFTTAPIYSKADIIVYNAPEFWSSSYAICVVAHRFIIGKKYGTEIDGRAKFWDYPNLRSKQLSVFLRTRV